MLMSTTNTTHDTVKSLNELLNEEKWTRATLNNYTVGNFKELDEILEQVEENDLAEEVREICEEHLQHTKNSIIALYISGLLDLSRQSVDDANLILLTKIFGDNHKWNIVEFLTQRILEFGENRFALRILADVYDNENQTDKLHDVWERLIRVDFEEADIVRQLAILKEEAGETETAVEYYKKALHRYITKKSFNNIKEMWLRLVELAPGETEFFYHAESKIARTISTDRAVQLLEALYPEYKKTGEWDRAIDLLKRVLAYDPKSPWGRKEIIECFEQKYADHSNLQEYIRVSNINQSWRPIHEAIADFEKHISFDKGNFVFHRSWGIGRIRDIAGDVITIDFAKKRGHSMSLKMAINALDVLAKDHIWVLRAVWK
jgi:transcription elongation factor GreA-like protein